MSCLSPPLWVTQLPHQRCHSKAGHCSSPTGSTGSKGESRGAPADITPAVESTTAVPQPGMAAPSPAQPPYQHRVGTVLGCVGSFAFLVLVGTGTLPEAELVVLEAQRAGTPWQGGYVL